MDADKDCILLAGVELESFDDAEDGPVALVTLIGNLLELEEVFNLVEEVMLVNVGVLVVFGVEEAVDCVLCPVESKVTGGFLVGYYSEDKLKAIVTETIMPVSYSSGPVSFQRNTVGMEPIWDKLYEDGLVYLGEWHSHPNGNASYSNTDKQALTNIAVSDSVKIANPIMLIIGFTKTKVKEIKAYYYKDTEIIRYE